jgi:hypothetical protein
MTGRLKRVSPVYERRERGDVVQMVQDPFTGDWWFRHRAAKRVWLFGEWKEVVQLTPWARPEIQTGDPRSGAELSTRQEAAMLPIGE